uniref:Major facilitator superfamily (MFS) profile domain-containing protein n=1 Tax=Chromera velia CCMP2878 TaxID=1169474 RepID=A0A0K6S7S1_9ALVE|eukprot:Cvel_22937.t1-p1 / transcript=Cvel_22937.t1 / gene=Cvel_22937 / organism=Chromera_velia_CCMP2878 / gene_product=hypothetical protein / transcript_product=hypothetical protein / location=Cvel_scaffold2308:6470-18661(+) / protein_length=866 / sequence_SO=supercontig / SO=protein_coding / is_pseudo=false
MTKLRASRFETKSLGLALDPDDATPGPGSYIKLNSFARDASTNKGFRDGPKGQQGGGQKDRERMSSLRACSAPSIPVHRQCFGFEEDDAGRLIRQPAPAEWMDGRGKDTAGPGHYDPRLDACAKRYDTACTYPVEKYAAAFGGAGENGEDERGASAGGKRRVAGRPVPGAPAFGGSERRFAGFQGDEYKRNVGPGSYPVHSAIEHRVVDTTNGTQGSAFASRSTRGGGIPKERVQGPSPAHYSLQSTLGAAKQLRIASEKEGFLSAEMRFNKGTGSTANAANPGPGAYRTPSSIRLKSPHPQAVSAAVPPTHQSFARPVTLIPAFDCHGNRFLASKHANFPGPEDLRLLSILWLMQFFELMMMSVLFPILPRLTTVSELTQACIFATRPATALIVSFPAGLLLDKVSWRPLLFVPFLALFLCNVCFAVACSMESAITRLALLLTARAVQGCSTAFLTPVVLSAIASTRPRSRVAPSTGVVYSSDFGAILGPLVGGFFFDRLGGIKVFSTLGLVAVVLLVLMLFVRPQEIDDYVELGDEGGDLSVAVQSNRRRSLEGLSATSPALLAHRSGSVLSDALLSLGGRRSSLPINRVKSLPLEPASFGDLMEPHYIIMVCAAFLSWCSFFAVEAILPVYWKKVFPSVSATQTGALLTPLLVMKFSMILLTSGASSAFARTLVGRKRGSGVEIEVPSSRRPSIQSHMSTVLEQEDRDLHVGLVTSRILHWAALGGCAMVALTSGTHLFFRDILLEAGWLGLLGMGLGLVHMSSTSWTQEYLEDRHLHGVCGRAFAILAGGMSFGAVVGPLASASLVEGGKSAGGDVRSSTLIAFGSLGIAGSCAAAALFWSVVTFPYTLGPHKQALLLGKGR